MIVPQETKYTAALAQLAQLAGQPLASLTAEQLLTAAAAATDIASLLVGEKVRRELDGLTEDRAAALVVDFRQSTGRPIRRLACRADRRPR